MESKLNQEFRTFDGMDATGLSAEVAQNQGRFLYDRGHSEWKCNSGDFHRPHSISWIRSPHGNPSIRLSQWCHHLTICDFPSEWALDCFLGVAGNADVAWEFLGLAINQRGTMLIGHPYGSWLPCSRAPSLSNTIRRAFLGEYDRKR